MEIERSKQLAVKASRNPPSAARGRPGGADDPKHSEVIRFYEDLTNLLVCNMKLQKAKHFNLDDWVLSCVYSYTDTNDDSPSSIKKSEFRRFSAYHMLIFVFIPRSQFHAASLP